MMLDLSSALWTTLNGPLRPPVALILYEDAAARDRLQTSVELQVQEGRRSRRSTDVEDAFRNPDEVVLLTASDEIGALDELAGRREALGERDEPVILFLLRRGSAHEHLSDPKLASLMGWVRGHLIDPAELEQIDVPAAREKFESLTGMSPEDWLQRWRSGILPTTLDNQLWFHDALLLVDAEKL